MSETEGEITSQTQSISELTALILTRNVNELHRCEGLTFLTIGIPVMVAADRWSGVNIFNRVRGRQAMAAALFSCLLHLVYILLW